MVPNTAQETINKWIDDGDTREQAIRRWKALARIKLPEIIRPLIKHPCNYQGREVK